MRRESDWFAKATTDGSEAAAAAFENIEQLLTRVQAVALDPARSTANLTRNHAQVDLHHVSGLDMLTISVNYGAANGGMFNPLGFEEYYRLRDEPSIEQDILDDLSIVLTSAFVIEETYWKEHKIRTVVTQVEPGERSSGSSVSGWLLPPHGSSRGASSPPDVSGTPIRAPPRAGQAEVSDHAEFDTTSAASAALTSDNVPEETSDPAGTGSAMT